MKEILFKAKRKDNEEWVEGDLNQNKDGIFITEQFEDFMLTKSYEVIPETVCQYIGVKDTNKKRIFEWDICKDEYDKLFIVEWAKEFCCWKFGNIKLWLYGNPLNWINNNVIKVGNKFDNIDLVKLIKLRKELIKQN